MFVGLQLQAYIDSCLQLCEIFTASEMKAVHLMHIMHTCTELYWPMKAKYLPKLAVHRDLMASTAAPMWFVSVYFSLAAIEILGRAYVQLVVCLCLACVVNCCCTLTAYSTTRVKL
jgi:hypothetical protein